MITFKTKYNSIWLLGKNNFDKLGVCELFFFSFARQAPVSKKD